ncbi:MAG: hypothetical protein IJ165_00385 [Proteobacteria bacterium]|nr:hypothetical protein [Pseudomonadota bacterium]
MSDTQPENTPQTETQPQETQQPEGVAPYIPQPRGEARIRGIDCNAVDARLAECSEYFLKHCDETDYRNLDWYLWRMQLRFAAGDDIFEVVDDAFLAARCLHDKSAMHLELKPPEMFMTRRIIPVELGILSGMPMLTLEFAATYGLPLMMVIGHTAPEDIMNEANLMTSYFRRDFCVDYYELTGLSAVIYAGVIAAIGRGFDDEAAIGLNIYARARDSVRGEPPKALLPKLKRYDALNTALACLCSGNFDAIGEVLAPAADAFLEDQVKRSGDAFLAPGKMPPPKYFDTSILTVIALAALRETVIDLPETGAIAAYRDFIRGLTEMPERRIEIPGLDEETRRILEQAGVDPDQLGVDHTFEDEKAASEARAAELFEEKQRLAQEAVRAKIAQEAAKENQERAEHEANKDEVSGGKNYSDFFSTLQDNEIPKFDDGSAENTQENAGKDFNAFFDDLKDNEIPKFDDGSDDDTQAQGKDFNAFFDDLKDNEIPKFDDGSDAASQSSARSFNQDFFSEEAHPMSDLKMTLDEPEDKTAGNADAEDESAATSKDAECASTDAAPSAVEAEFADIKPHKDFSRFFDEDTPHVPADLQMSLPEDDKAIEPPKDEPQLKTEPAPIPSASSRNLEAEFADIKPHKDFSRFFDEDTPHVPADLAMALPEDGKSQDAPQADNTVAPAPETKADIPQRNLEAEFSDITPHKDFSNFFADDDSDDRRDNYDRETQLRELEEEQARKAAEQAAKEKLKLELDGTEEDVKVAESYQERMARLIAEKQAAVREQALKEREEAERELEELKKTGVSKPVIEQLQLTPTESTDPDEKVEKVAPEDLVIKGFAYTDLDMIHANTAVREDIEEDFDMHAAMAKTAFEEAQKEQKPSTAEYDKDNALDDAITGGGK